MPSSSECRRSRGGCRLADREGRSMKQLPIPVHVGSEPPESWDDVEARQREFGEDASPRLQEQRRPTVARPTLDWSALGFEPRWVGFDTPDCVAALQPSIFAGHGAEEFDRFRL